MVKENKNIESYFIDFQLLMIKIVKSRRNSPTLLLIHP